MVVPFRQIAVLLVAGIAIVGAALFVMSRGDDDPESVDAGATTTTSSAVSSTSSTTTTPPPATTTSIPVACSAEDATPDGTAEEETADGTAEDETAEDDESVGPTLGPNSSVSTVGLDTVSFGLTVVQAERAAGTPMIPCDPVGDCYRVTPQEAPEGISFVVRQGTIERVDIVAGPITTKSGAGIGTTAERLVELFGDRLERQVLDTDTVDLIFVPTDENDAQFRVVFTVVDGVVDTFRAGRVPLVLETDPCGA